MHQEAQFQELLKKRGLRYTQERKFIFDKVSRLKEHFSADSLYERLKKENSRISRATVYRTIPFLLEVGALQKSIGQGKREFFEAHSPQKPHHDHLYCIGCHRVVEFHCQEIEELQESVCKKYGFELSFHDHRLYGRCEGCRGK